MKSASPLRGRRRFWDGRGQFFTPAGEVAKALAAGAMVIHPIKDQFYGDRSGTLTDPSGHLWTIATHMEDVEPAEMQRRMKAMTAGGQQP